MQRKHIQLLNHSLFWFHRNNNFGGNRRDSKLSLDDLIGSLSQIQVALSRIKTKQLVHQYNKSHFLFGSAKYI